MNSSGSFSLLPRRTVVCLEEAFAPSILMAKLWRGCEVDEWGDSPCAFVALGGVGRLNGSDGNKYGYCDAVVGERKVDVTGVSIVSSPGASGVLKVRDLFR